MAARPLPRDPARAGAAGRPLAPGWTAEQASTLRRWPARTRAGVRGWLAEHAAGARAWLAVPVAFVLGAVPFTNLMAVLTRGVDLRRVGTGTVSGTGLYEVAGFGPLAVAGVCDVAKGAVGPALAGRGRPVLAAVAAGAAVAGHNWSPFLRGAGGRGLSPAIGALAVTAPAGAATLLGGMVLGRLAGETAVGALAAELAVTSVARRAHGRRAAGVAAAVAFPMVAKRLAGNARPPRRTPGLYLWRLLFDRDTARPPASTGVAR